MNRNLETDIPEHVRPMVTGYLTRRLKDAEHMQTCCREGDFQEIAAMAHKLKGNGTGFGFPVITQIGGELEAAAKEGNHERARALIGEFTEIVGYYHEKL